MPHNPAHHSDFRHYASTRAKVQRRIAELRAYLPRLQAVVEAMPATNEEAGYLDLDNAQQLATDLDEAVSGLVDWEAVHAAAKENSQPISQGN